MISVVDNTGDAGSGILLADAAYETVADYPVGARITLTLDATSTVYNSYGLYKINKVSTTRRPCRWSCRPSPSRSSIRTIIWV